MSEPFLGQITFFGFNFPPLGWMQCQGQLLPISQYTALFSLLGTQCGGDGRTNFGLPDLRGRVPVSQGQGPGLQDYLMGELDGVLHSVVVAHANLIKPAEFREIVKIRRTEFVWALVAMAGVVLLGTLQGIVTAIVVSLVALAYRM